MRDNPTIPPPSPNTIAQGLREKATEARIRATRELHRAKELEEIAAKLEREQRR